MVPRALPRRGLTALLAWRVRLSGLAVWGILTACGAGGGSRGAASTLDLGLAARVVLGSGELWLVQVRESEQGGRDGNGDGDALDELVYVVDLARGLRPEALVAPGLALASLEGAPLFACDGQAAAVAVDEAAHGGLDLNADGDALDRVLFVYRRAAGDFANLGLAVRGFEVGGALVAAAVDEHDQGARDLDGDGDADGTIVAVHDLMDGSTTTLALRDSSPLLVRDGSVALRLAERPGLDLSLDGDDQDAAVLELYDGARRLLTNTTLVLACDGVASAGGTFGVSVSEAGFGRGDLSGDGDTDDAVFHVFDPARGFSVNLGLSVPLFPPPLVDGTRYLLSAREAPGGEDTNGDGDLEDLVAWVFEPESGRLLETGLATQGGAALSGGWIGVSVPEAMQGARDLDGDGEADGNVVHLLELASGRVLNLGLDAFTLQASPARVFLAPFEGPASTDWNGDGDQDDRVLFDWSASDDRAHSGAAIGALLAVQGEHALLLARERERDGDGNADGDADDLLLELFDARTGTTTALGLAAGSAARLGAGLTVLALVEEAAQGRDLNADGDLADEVLHLVPPR